MIGVLSITEGDLLRLFWICWAILAIFLVLWVLLTALLPSGRPRKPKTPGNRCVCYCAECGRVWSRRKQYEGDFDVDYLSICRECRELAHMRGPQPPLT